MTLMVCRMRCTRVYPASLLLSWRLQTLRRWRLRPKPAICDFPGRSLRDDDRKCDNSRWIARAVVSLAAMLITWSRLPVYRRPKSSAWCGNDYKLCQTCSFSRDTTVALSDHIKRDTHLHHLRLNVTSCDRQFTLHCSVRHIWTRGQSNLTKSASRRAHSPVRGHPRGSKFVPLNSWGRVSY